MAANIPDPFKLPEPGDWSRMYVTPWLMVRTMTGWNSAASQHAETIRLFRKDSEVFSFPNNPGGRGQMQELLWVLESAYNSGRLDKTQEVQKALGLNIL
jgi:hypothetical protein